MKKSAIFILTISMLVFMLSGCSNENLTDRDEISFPPAPNTRQPSIIVNDTYYFITGLSTSIEIDENDYLGVVTSTVPLSQIPTMNGQSNFVLEGTPYAEYEDGIVALIDGKWVIFEPWDDELVSAYVNH